MTMRTVLRELRLQHVVRFTCARCQHHFEKSAPLMAARFGEWKTLEELEPRLVCSKCGNKDGNFISYGLPEK